MGGFAYSLQTGGYENFSVSQADHQGLVDILRNEEALSLGRNRWVPLYIV